MNAGISSFGCIKDYFRNNPQLTYTVQGYSRVIMGLTNIETQPLIHFHRLRGSYTGSIRTGGPK
jgi:hypothetical protein